MKALARPLRARILAILAERVASPKEIAEQLGEGLTTVSYHVRVLVECGVIELDRKVQRRGAVEHFYRAVHSSLLPPGVWDRFTPAMRKGVSASIVREFFDDASASMDAGVFDAPPGELSWTPLVLDELGVEEIGQLTRDFLEAIFEAQSAASERLAGAENGNSCKAASATVFLASFLSARDPRDGRKASATKRR
jgi:DNA-binding transcriptional ArsR family regulator